MIYPKRVEREGVKEMDMQKLLKRVGNRPEVIAANLDISVQTVRNWANGVKIPTLPVDKMKVLTERLGCSFDELVAAVEESKIKRAERLASGDDKPWYEDDD